MCRYMQSPPISLQSAAFTINTAPCAKIVSVCEEDLLVALCCRLASRGFVWVALAVAVREKRVHACLVCARCGNFTKRPRTNNAGATFVKEKHMAEWGVCFYRSSTRTAVVTPFMARCKGRSGCWSRIRVVFLLTSTNAGPSTRARLRTLLREGTRTLAESQALKWTCVSSIFVVTRRNRRRCV